MNSEGQIDITLTVLASGKKRVRIVNNRPVHAAKLLIGKTIDEALTIIPLLYHVCGNAQGYAAIRAMQAALNSRSDETTDLARRVLADVELMREHLLRIFLDWPSLGEGDLLEADGSDDNAEHSSKTMAEIMGFSSTFKTAVFQAEKPFSPDTTAVLDKELLINCFDELEAFLTSHIFGCGPELWLTAHSGAGVFHWMRQSQGLAARSCAGIIDKGWEQVGETSIPFLPKLTKDQCADLLFPNAASNRDCNDFIAAPTWAGLPHETSALSRYHGHPFIKRLLAHCGTGLLARYVSRLVELSMVFKRIKQTIQRLTKLSKSFNSTAQKEVSLAPSIGIGLVEAARGLLIHGVKLEDGIIMDYKILAPTEWNFHPEGVLSNALATIETVDAIIIKQIAGLLIPAIDPCTKTSLEVHYA